MEGLIITLIIFAVLFIIYIIAVICTYNYIFRRDKRETPLLEVDLEKTHYKPYINVLEDAFRFWDNTKGEKVEIKSFDGIKLVADYYDNKSDKLAILFHGYKATPLNNFALPGMFLLEKGYNLLIITQRAHGESEGKYITFGHLERFDCISWINEANKRYNPKSIVLYGVSMGCATVAMATELGMPNNVKGLILDCGFTNSYDEIKHECKRSFKVTPYPVLWGVRIFSHILGHFGMLDGKSDEALRKNEIPALFIHGTDDRTVPYEMGVKNFEACKGKKEMITTNAWHAMSYYYEQEKVENKIEEFLKENIG